MNSEAHEKREECGPCETVDPQAERQAAIEAVSVLQSTGFTAFWAGGCVRDLLMRRTPKDHDIATDAEPEAVVRLFPGAIATGKSFGVVRVPIGGRFLEVATFRQDHGYSDGRHPNRVSYTDAREDARRRDFTVNAIFYNPTTLEFHDYVDGRRDIEARLIRCVGDPSQRLSEDYLRMMRAVRFASTLGFRIEPETESAIRTHAGKLKHISEERVGEEFARILLESPRAGDALRLLNHVGLLDVILPEVAAMRGQAQPEQFHPEGDVFDHTVLMLNLMKTATLPLAYALLLHDVGKPLTAAVSGGRLRFNGHPSVGARLAEHILRRMRVSSRDAATIAHCIRNHMTFVDVPRMKRSTLRRFVGSPAFPIELDLHRLDCLASHGSLDTYEFLLRFREQLKNEPVLPRAWVTGHDIMRMGLSEGPVIGAWCKRAYDAQLEGRFAGRDELLAWIEHEMATSTPPTGPSE